MSEKLNVESKYTPYSVYYNVTGPTEDVKSWCKNLTDRYHPAGYGTSYKISDIGNGNSTATAYHSRSSD